MSGRRVVVTGLGAVTPLGNTVPEFWSALAQGKSGIDKIQAFDVSAYDCQIAGEIKGFNPVTAFKNPKEVKRTDRYTQVAMAAAKEAVQEAGLLSGNLNLDRIGVLVGSGIGGLGTLEAQHTVLMQKGPGRLSPFLIPMLISNIASGLISMEYGFRGPNFAVVTACATSGQSVGEAWRVIRDDDADVIVAGGSESTICPMAVGGFGAMRALSTRNDEPQRASRPFDKARDGFVMAEGAGVMVLEELEHAKRRGAKIYGEIIGYGQSADAHHMTAPSPEGAGAALAMQNALKRAQINPEAVDYINAHGTSTPQGDVCETMAVKKVFGAHAKKVMVSSTKSMTGHLLGAAGAVELAICVKAIETGIIPPTINLDDPDPECDLDYVPHKAREAKIDVAMSNSFGFGGHNCSLIVKRYA
ncbi:MAG: beta-ketoacyl-ACP synthase II [Verrucomicrobiae bacterium]|nr:beta-ketoacyl-ACP synthase II [Verrucomicrobiae bacterium]